MTDSRGAFGTRASTIVVLSVLVWVATVTTAVAASEAIGPEQRAASVTAGAETTAAVTNPTAYDPATDPAAIEEMLRRRMAAKHGGQTGASMGTVAFAAAGPAWLRLGALDDRLRGAGYEATPRTTWPVGGGTVMFAGGRMLGAEGYWLPEVALAGDDGRRARLGGGWGLFQLGFAGRLAPGLVGMPRFGVGGGRLRLELPPPDDVAAFDEILSEPAAGAELTAGGFLMDFGIEFHWVLDFAEDETRNGFVVGLRTGWMLALGSWDWEAAGAVVPAGPAAGIDGPYLRLTLGLGGMARAETGTRLPSDSTPGPDESVTEP